MTESVPSPKPRTGAVEHWDAIVVGAGLGGLSAAAHLAAGGKRTLLLERYSVLGGSSHVFRRKGGWEFDVGVHYIGDCGPDGQTPTLLRGLGIDIEFLPLDRHAHDVVLGPDLELKVPASWDGWLENLIAAFPEDERALRRFIGMLRQCAEGVDRSRSFASRAGLARLGRAAGRYAPLLLAPTAVVQAACGLSPRAMLAIGVHLGAIGTTPDAAPLLAHAVVMGNFLGSGGWYPRGGGQVFSAEFSNVVLSHGGEVRTSVSVNRIIVEAGAVSGVETADGQVLRAPVVVAAGDILRTYRDLVGWEHLPRALKLRAERWKMAWPLINSFFGVARDYSGTPNSNYFVIPSWDEATSLFALNGGHRRRLPAAHRRDPLEWARDYAANQPTFVQCSTLRDPRNTRSAPAGSAAIEAQSLVPWAPRLWGLTEASIADGTYRKSPLYREIKEILLDGLADRVEAAYPGSRSATQFRELGSPAAQVRFTHTTQGNCMGLEPRVGQVGVGRPGTRTAIKGLFLAGAGTAFGPGTEGAMTSGQWAASAALGRDLDAEVRAGAVLADRARLAARADDFDPLAATRLLGSHRRQKAVAAAEPVAQEV